MSTGADDLERVLVLQFESLRDIMVGTHREHNPLRSTYGEQLNSTTMAFDSYPSGLRSSLSSSRRKQNTCTVRPHVCRPTRRHSFPHNISISSSTLSINSLTPAMHPPHQPQPKPLGTALTSASLRLPTSTMPAMHFSPRSSGSTLPLDPIPRMI